MNASTSTSPVAEDKMLLRIRLLGACSLRYGGESVATVRSPRLQSLLAFLLLHRSAPQSRRHLAFTLWPDSTESQALTNLRRELHNLREALPDAGRFLSIATQALQWQPDAPYVLDVAEFEQALAAGDAAEQNGDLARVREALVAAVDLYQGELLPGHYDDWLLGERERLRLAYQQALQQLVALLTAQRDYRLAIDYAQRLLRADPLAEEPYLHLIRLYAATGDRARALRTYHTCVTTLQRELGVEPGPATRQAYEQVLRASAPEQPPPLPQPAFASSSPLVGRQREWQRLQACWQMALHQGPQFVAVTGEAGIGKTRLLEELVDWATHQGIMTAQTRSYASEGGLAYAPVTDWLRAPSLRADLLRLEEVWLSQVARLLPEIRAERPALPAPEPITEGWQRQQFYEALARAIFTGGRPLLLVIDDLQWTDQETLAWLRYLLRPAPSAPLLVAAAIRSTEVDAGHPLVGWLAGMRRTDQMTEIELVPFDEAETASLAAHIAGAELDAGSSAHLYAETEGNPLFIVETVRAGERASARLAGLSPKIQSVIESRLAQLSYPARRIANLAAAIGRSFAFDVLAAASEEDEGWLVQGLDELWHQRIIREQSDQDYDFSHNKIREVVYNSLSAANRRLLHRRIAGAMEIIYASTLDTVSKELALQYEAAGTREKAAAYYLRAGQLAQQVYANAEAIQLYGKALALLETLPETRDRAEQELVLQRQLSIAQRNTKGYAATEVGQALSRARALGEQLGQGDDLAPILWGLFTFNFVRSDLRAAQRLGEELFRLGQAHHSPELLQQAHYALGGALSSRGQLAESVQHFDRQIALYDPSQHRAQVAMFGVDLGIFCQAWSPHPLWHLGFLDQAHQRNENALALAKQMGHPFSQALALAYATMLFQFGRDGALVQESAAATIDFCAEHSIGYYDHWATILHGWALAEQGAVKAGIEQMQNGLVGLRASHAEARLPYYLTLLAETYAQDGQIEAALQRLDEALAIAAKNDDVWYNAETYRLRGELLLQSGKAADAERSLQTSLDISRRQGARTLELRTALTLAPLWLAQERLQEARTLLGGIYDSFSDGFDTLELQAVRKLLDALE